MVAPSSIGPASTKDLFVLARLKIADKKEWIGESLSRDDRSSLPLAKK